MESLDLNKARLDTNGYYYVYQPAHPLANKAGKVYVHRYEASLKAGRWLRPEEHVHHKNGVRVDNHQDNLDVLSSSEHAALHLCREVDTKIVSCASCGKEVDRLVSNLSRIKNAFCSQSCAHNYSERFSVSKEELEKLVWEYPTTEVAQMFGVSDTAIAKRCRRLGVSKPPRGYWRKIQTGKL